MDVDVRISHTQRSVRWLLTPESRPVCIVVRTSTAAANKFREGLQTRNRYFYTVSAHRLKRPHHARGKHSNKVTLKATIARLQAAELPGSSRALPACCDAHRVLTLEINETQFSISASYGFPARQRAHRLLHSCCLCCFRCVFFFGGRALFLV